jgi:hypothetical protein
MVKVAEPTLLPLGTLKLSSVHPGAVHRLPFQPSPYESIISKTQVPGGTKCVAAYGAPPEIGLSRPSQASDHSTSFCHVPPSTVTTEAIKGDAGGAGGGNGDTGSPGGAGGGEELGVRSPQSSQSVP